MRLKPVSPSVGINMYNITPKHLHTFQYIPEIVNMASYYMALRAGKMNQIARCDWLPERARWSHLARSGLPSVSSEKNFSKSHIINPLLTKFVRSRWLELASFFFCEFMDLDFVSVHKHAKKRTWSICSHLDLTLGQ